MKTAENIKKVALVLFFLTGTFHILAGMMASNGYFVPGTLILHRSLDIPFAMTAITYGLSSVYIKVPEKQKKLMGTIFEIIAVAVFLALIYINFLIPDRLPL